MTLTSKLALNGFFSMNRRKMLALFVAAAVSLAPPSASGYAATNRMA